MNFDFDSIKDLKDIIAIKEKGEKALDYLWTQSFVKTSIGEIDQEKVEALQRAGKAIDEISDIVIVVATKKIGSMIKAMITNVENKENVEMVVFYNTLSGKTYQRVIEQIEGKDFSVIAVSAGFEDIAFKSAFACFRKLLIEKYGPSDAGMHMFNIVNDQDGYLAGETSQDDIRSYTLPKDIEEEFCGNTEAILLPMAAAGIDIISYLEGIRDIVSSPMWDKDGPLFALGLAIFGKTDVVVYQEELLYIKEWIDCFQERFNYNNPFKLWLFLEKEDVDIALPSFPGCSEDGSLNILLKEHFEEEYQVSKNHCNAVSIRISDLSPYLLGQINGFVEISFGITSFILGN